MNRLRSNIFFIVALLLLNSALHSIAGTPDKRGTTGAQELLIPVGARGVALSGSLVSYTSGVEAMFWNPAGIATTEASMEMLFFHQTHLADISHIYSGFVYNFREAGAVGISVKYLDVGTMPVTTDDQPEGTGETFSPHFVTYGLTYARTMTDLITLGATAKLVTEKVLDISATGVAFDFGMQYDTGVDGLKLGFVVQNLGPSMTFNGPGLDDKNTVIPRRTVIAQFSLPTSLQVGLSYEAVLNSSNKFTLSGKVQNNSYDVDEYVTGLEYNFENLLYLRGGYDYASEAQHDYLGNSTFAYDYSLGFGVHLTPMEDTHMSFEYAYRHAPLFSGNHSLGLKISL